MICDADLRVAGVEVLASRDTRDHVQAIERDQSFFRSFVGRSLDEIAMLTPAKEDAVAGATLTSLAITEALVLRLGGAAAASRFETIPRSSTCKSSFLLRTGSSPTPVTRR